MFKFVAPFAVVVAAVVVIAAGAGVGSDTVTQLPVALAGPYVAPIPGFHVVRQSTPQFAASESSVTSDSVGAAAPPGAPPGPAPSPEAGGPTTTPGFSGPGSPDAPSIGSRDESLVLAAPGAVGDASFGSTAPVTGNVGSGAPSVPDTQDRPPSRPARPPALMPGPSVPPVEPTSPPVAPTKPPIDVTPPPVELTPTQSPTPKPTATPTPTPTPPTSSPWARCPWPSPTADREELPGLDLSEREEFTDASGARVVVARDAGLTGDTSFDMVMRVVEAEATHMPSDGNSWFSDVDNRDFPASVGAAILRGNPANEPGFFRLSIKISFHRAGAVVAGDAAPWDDSRVPVTAAMTIFDLDGPVDADRERPGRERLGLDARLGVGLSPATHVAKEPADLGDGQLRWWSAVDNSPPATALTHAVFVVFDTAHDVQGTPLTLEFERTNVVGRRVTLGGLSPPLSPESWVCQ